MTRRGVARRTRSATAQIASYRASSRSAAAGISAISRAMAVVATRSAALMLALMRNFGNRRPQIAVVAGEDLRGIGRRHSEAEEDGDLHVAVRLFDEGGRIGHRAPAEL